METLGKSQQAVLDFIKAFIKQKSIPPTVREICAAVGLKSTSTVHMHLKALERKGYILMDRAKQRSISLPHAIAAETQAVPLIGSVAAGNPVSALEMVEEAFSLPSSWLHGGTEHEVFMLRVEGESMIDAGIYAGDMIIVHNAVASENGDIVVARIQGDTVTVKRMFKEKERIRLQPENAAMEPIYARYEDVVIIGKVIGLIRRY